MFKRANSKRASLWWSLRRGAGISLARTIFSLEERHLQTVAGCTGRFSSILIWVHVFEVLDAALCIFLESLAESFCGLPMRKFEEGRTGVFKKFLTTLSDLWIALAISRLDFPSFDKAVIWPFSKSDKSDPLGMVKRLEIIKLLKISNVPIS